MASYRELVGMLEALVRAARAKNLSSHGSLVGRADALIEEARRGLLTEKPWTPLRPARRVPRTAENRQMVAELFKAHGKDVDAIDAETSELWVNDRYQVDRRRNGDIMWLSIKRIDQQQIHSWRDMQRIKDQVLGPECEAVELYPAQSRLVDTANQYHLWGVVDPGYRFPFGFDERMVTGHSGVGENQAPMEEQGGPS